MTSNNQVFPPQVYTYLSKINEIKQLSQRINKLRAELTTIEPAVKKWLQEHQNTLAISTTVPAAVEKYGRPGKLRVVTHTRRQPLKKETMSHFINMYFTRNREKIQRALQSNNDDTMAVIADDCSTFVWNARPINTKTGLVRKTKNELVPRRKKRKHTAKKRKLTCFKNMPPPSVLQRAQDSTQECLRTVTAADMTLQSVSKLYISSAASAPAVSSSSSPSSSLLESSSVAATCEVYLSDVDDDEDVFLFSTTELPRPIANV